MWDEETQWPQLLEIASKDGKFTTEEVAALQSSVAGKIICNTTYYSRCINPGDTAVKNLIIFVSESREKAYYIPRDIKNLRNRILARIRFPGGNPYIEEAGMMLLEIFLIEDHKKCFPRDGENSEEIAILLEEHNKEKQRILRKYNKLDPVTKECFADYYEAIVNM